jgi:K+ transporter
MQERDAKHPGNIAVLGFAALGVVFGDIGTSPLYTLKTVLDLTGDSSPAAVLGVLSLIVWTLVALLMAGRVEPSASAIKSSDEDPACRSPKR